MCVLFKCLMVFRSTLHKRNFSELNGSYSRDAKNE
jgi:hypothetical protein